LSTPANGWNAGGVHSRLSVSRVAPSQMAAATRRGVDALDRRHGFGSGNLQALDADVALGGNSFRICDARARRLRAHLTLTRQDARRGFPSIVDGTLAVRAQAGSGLPPALAAVVAA
jgi:hypothetical protein